jgi:hypothetical protein
MEIPSVRLARDLESCADSSTTKDRYGPPGLWSKRRHGNVNVQLNFDDRYLALSRPQTQNLERVTERISRSVLSFFSFRKRMRVVEFHAEDVYRWVVHDCGYISPDSPGRIMRLLRQRGLIDYEVVNRAKSLYRCGA